MKYKSKLFFFLFAFFHLSEVTKRLLYINQNEIRQLILHYEIIAIFLIFIAS